MSDLTASESFSLIPTRKGFWLFDLPLFPPKKMAGKDLKDFFGQYSLGEKPSHFPFFHLSYHLEEGPSFICIYQRKRWISWNSVPAISGHKPEFKHCETPSFEEYRKSFNRGVGHLERGDCYQFNLTYQFKIECVHCPKDPYQLAKAMWANKKSSPFAHMTFFKNDKKLFLSNSPECLFSSRTLENKKIRLWSTPIKGTTKWSEGRDGPLEIKWRELRNCPKNDSELNMITDLLRNDLSSINEPTAKVLSKKNLLIVPGLIHQYSMISVDLPEKTKLSTLVEKLHPAGSITGAPKKRVMNILDKIETSPRGLYSGSTIHHNGEGWVSSINIRTLDLNWENGWGFYGAGGGITAQSQCHEEYEEMILKVQSFTSLLTK